MAVSAHHGRWLMLGRAPQPSPKGRRGAKRGRATKGEQEYLEAVQALGCIAGDCRAPAEIHHIRSGIGKGLRASNFEVLPLCEKHHRTGGHGVAFHAGPRTWQEKFGYERDLLEQVERELAIQKTRVIMAG